MNLTFQYDWRGAQLQNLYILVCKICLDVPQEQLRAIILPADPVPIFYPSVEDFDAAETDYLTLNGGNVPVTDSDGNTVTDSFGQVITAAVGVVTDPLTGIPVQSNDYLTTQNCENITGQPIGRPEGMTQAAVMPLEGTVEYGVPLSPVAVYAIGNTVTVTCSVVHGLQPGKQVAIQGLAGGGNGFFTVAVPTATMFTYQTLKAVSPQLAPTTRMITANIGLPRGYGELPL